MSQPESKVVWNVHDKEIDTKVTHRDRPHWDQSGALTFVTFRLADSMPKSVLQRWEAEQQQWIRSKGLQSVNIQDVLQRRDVPENIRRQFLKFRKQRWHENLDDCHGCCLLREPLHAGVVADSLLKFEGERYDLERFVIMPNHVHLLVQMRFGWDLREQCEGWLRYTGRQINQRRETSGAFWQSEPFDHIVRSDIQFEYLQKYIADNPRKAHLKPGEFLLWIRDHGFQAPLHDSPSREETGHDSESRATEE